MYHLLITRLEGDQEEDVPGLEVSPRTSKRNGMLRKQYKDIAFSLVIFFFLMMKTTTQAVWEKGQRSLCSISGPYRSLGLTVPIHGVSHSLLTRVLKLRMLKRLLFALKCSHSGRKVLNERTTR